MELLSKEIRLYPRQTIRAILRHMGPEFWIVAFYPFYISWVWASGEIAPSYDWLMENPTHPGNLLERAFDWLARSWDFVVAALVIGPLLGGATLLFGDYNDREEDLNNPRKLRLPFYERPIRPETFLYTSVTLFAASLVLALLVSLAFFALAAIIVALSVLYSAGPARLKSRPGLDLLTNMLGFGVLCSFAGWVLVEPIGSYPWLWLLPMVLGTGALYLPTVIADAESDSANGVRTIAVDLGVKRTIALAIGLLVLANVAILSLGLVGYLYEPEVVKWVWPISLLEIVPFAYLIRRRELSSIIRGLFIAASFMGIGTFLLMLNSVGIWVP